MHIREHLEYLAKKLGLGADETESEEDDDDEREKKRIEDDAVEAAVEQLVEGLAHGGEVEPLHEQFIARVRPPRGLSRERRAQWILEVLSAVADRMKAQDNQ